MEAPTNLDPIVRQDVEEAIGRVFGDASVAIVETERFPFAQVFRCVLSSDRDIAPRTIIVRVPRAGDEPRSGSAGLDRERAALLLLANGGTAFAPRFLAGGAAAGYLASEDLGKTPSVLDLLLGQDESAATAGAVGFARSLVRCTGRLFCQPAKV